MKIKLEITVDDFQNFNSQPKLPNPIQITISSGDFASVSQTFAVPQRLWRENTLQIVKDRIALITVFD